MRRTARACLLVCMVALATAVPAAGTVEPPVGDGTGGVRMKHLGRFYEPVYATTAPGQAGRDLVFVVERGGIVRVLRGPKLIAKPFLDIPAWSARGRSSRGCCQSRSTPTTTTTGASTPTSRAQAAI